jgi:multiple sugar transport system ATP-binding protein
MLRVQMRGEIGKLHKRLGTTMIYVTHDQVEAMTMGDRIVVMLDGEIQQIATPMDLYNRPKNRFVAGFIGTPPMNFLEGELRGKNGTLSFVAGEGRVQLEVDARHQAAVGRFEGKHITLGLRPEAFIENRAQQAIAGRSLEAIVTLVEPLGPETFLYLDAAAQALTARVPGEVLPRVQSAHVLDVDMSRAHFFDPITEAAM